MGEVYVDTVLEAYNLTTSPYKMSATKLDPEIEYNNVVSYFKIARNRVRWIFWGQVQIGQSKIYFGTWPFTFERPSIFISLNSSLYTTLLDIIFSLDWVYSMTLAVDSKIFTMIRPF